MVKIFAWLLAAMLPCAAYGEDFRLLLESSLSHDTDGQQESEQYAGYVAALPSQGKGSSAGLRAGYLELADTSNRLGFAALRLDYQRNLDDRLKYALRFKQLASSDWSPTLGGAGISYEASPRWHFEGSADSDIIDTVSAASRHLRVVTYNLAADDHLDESWTVVAGVLHQNITDGNVRTGGLLKLVFAPPSVAGFNVQLRVRRVASDFAGVGYFAPERLTEALLLFQYGAALPGDKWTLTALAGGGTQRVNDQDSARIYRAELRLRGWFTEHLGLEGQAGCSNTGGFNTSSAGGGYRYCFGHVGLIGSW